MTEEYSPLTALLLAPPWRVIHGGLNTPLLVGPPWRIIPKEQDGTPLAGRVEEGNSPFSKGGFRGITRVYLVVSLLPTQAGWSGCSSLPVYKHMAFRPPAGGLTFALKNGTSLTVRHF